MADLLLGSAESILSLCGDVYKMVQTAKSNKTQCQQVADRVRTLEKMVLSIKQRPDSVSPDVKSALIDLARSLKNATELMGKVSKANALVKVLNSGNNESKFQEVSQKLNQDMQVLSMALQISHGDTLREGLRTIVAEHRATTAQSLAPLRRKPVMRVTQADQRCGGDDNGSGGDKGPGASDGGAAQDSTTLVANILLSSVDKVKPPDGKVPLGAPLAKLSQSKAPVPASPTRMILVSASPETKVPAPKSQGAPAHGSTSYSSGQSPIHMPEPTLMSPLLRPMMSPMPMVSPRPMVSPMPTVSPMPMVSPRPMMSPMPMVSPMVSPPVSSFPYSYAPTPSAMSFSLMPMAYQQPPNTAVSTFISYNRAPSSQALKLAQAFAPGPPHSRPQSHMSGNILTNIYYTR
ncbi:nascent polypeptide-associated complex subunit alpha, muscle-specific form isoform X2 [Syngnathus typhle]|uniref:nascent polypeptide-associated complex subunit alpha, muscle-specific form isoform X2 n=1 Tax=Syngnathus typhle TaxID=161592 RepID=UPI002A69932D|nr:nascent polypeptide-associated complex subunit alpha, muscle-specific form isoform X2 [Syngnathus typhle]